MACRVPFVFCCILSLFMQFGLLEQSRLNEENLALEQLIKENAKSVRIMNIAIFRRGLWEVQDI